ncbi:MAG TPA: SRPBCC domain-containing protein [Tepidisphaeraceae bacterium]|jgi:uncharacterized protein YndB with AHSA1/START domain
MTATTTETPVQTLEIVREEVIDAPIEIVFQAILDEIGPESQMLDGRSFPMTLEPWPGGRWFRDLGNNAGHFWGNVQVIKPPMLLELAGPMMMSYASANHIQYRLVSEGATTRLKFRHQAIGLITDDHRTGVQEGWSFKLNRVRNLATQRATSHV